MFIKVLNKEYKEEAHSVCMCKSMVVNITCPKIFKYFCCRIIIAQRYR